MSNLTLELQASHRMIPNQINNRVDQGHHYMSPQTPRIQLLAGLASQPAYTAPTGVFNGNSGFGSRPAKRQKLPCVTDMVSASTTISSTPLSASTTMFVPTRRRTNSTSSSSKIMATSRQAQAQAQAKSQSPTHQGQAPIPAKSKRTRTGCLTCRGRHLKCDEGLPDCANCRKTNRQCLRGLRLNFMYMQVQRPPRMSQGDEWSVQFHDESRQIASEYRGGLSRYAPMDTTSGPTSGPALPLSTFASLSSPTTSATDAASCVPPPSDVVKLEIDEDRSSPPDQPALTDQGLPMSTELDGLIIHRTSHRSSVSSVTSMMVNVDTRDNSDVGSINGSALDGGATSDRDEHGPVASPSAVLASGPMSTPSTKSSPTPPSGSGETPRVDKTEIVSAPKEPTGRTWLRSPEEAYFMQVFVEQVGVWMDSFDKDKHFSRLIPYQALKSPMLLNSFLACGVRHLTLIEPEYKDEKALFYYDTATTQLLRSLQNPDRDMSECAVAAVVLNVYEIMSERPTRRMSHIAGARALIRECGWNAKSTGIGAACFWLNIGMEVLSCLSFNWETAWDPDQWGLDMGFEPTPPSSSPATPLASDASTAHSPSTSTPREPDTPASNGSGGGGLRNELDLANGTEEVWVHRIFYIVAKIANFRATAPKFPESSSHGEQVHLASRLAQWHGLKRLCGRWNACCPRTMHPLAYIAPGRAGAESVFPKIWLTVRASVIGRLFYHTAECLLAQTKPTLSCSNNEMRVSQLHHAHQICGIVAHATDPGVASVAIRSLAIAATVLTRRSEQQEVLRILGRIHRQSGWRLDSVVTELEKTWGWERSASKLDSSHGEGGQHQHQHQSACPHQDEQLHSSQQQHQRNVAGSRIQLPSRSQPQTSQLPEPDGSNQANLTPTQIPMGLDTISTKPPMNPLFFGDFSHPNHPYQNWYEPPNRPGAGPFEPGFF